jgi:hypothetical protein
METEISGPAPANATSSGPVMSLPARLLNVFATPEDVFESLARGGESSTGNWLLPVLLSCVVGIVYVLVGFAQPNVQQQIRDQQEQQLQKLADSGKMSAGDLEAARNRLEQINTITLVKISGAVGSVVMSFITVFTVALVLKAMAHWVLKQPVAYMKLVEVAGLAGMISVLGTIVQLLLVVIMGSIFVSAGPVLFIQEIDPHNKVHLLLASLNLMSFWYLAVLGVGLAKVARARFLQAAVPLLILWAVLRAVIMLAGWGKMGL